jgi:hypothetical protein
VKQVSDSGRHPYLAAFAFATGAPECLDHVIVLNEAVPYLAQDTPEPRAVQPLELGAVVAIPHLADFTTARSGAAPELDGARRNSCSRRSAARTF